MPAAKDDAGADEYADVTVIGAGLAGLAAAWRLRDRKPLVLEASDRVGGRIRSEPHGTYWLNLGAHMFGGPETNVGRLVAELGLDTRPILGSLMGVAYRGTVLSGGAAATYPVRLPLSLPGRLSFIGMGLRLRRGARRLIAELGTRPGETAAAWRMRVLSFENDRTLKDFVGPLHPEAELFLRTILERTSATPEHMAAGYGLTSFTNVWSHAAPGRNMVGGSEQLPRALAAALAHPVRTGCAVSDVRHDGAAVVVTYRTASGVRRVRSNHAVVATPAYAAARIVGDLPGETRQALDDIPYGAFLSVAVLTGETTPMPWDRSYAIATPDLSFGVFFNQATVLRTGPRAPGGSLMLFCGAARAQALFAHSDASIERTFVADLDKLYPGASRIAREAVVQRWPNGAPFARPGRARLQAALTRDLGRIVLAGDYLEFPNMEAAVKTGIEAAAAVTRKAAATPGHP